MYFPPLVWDNIRDYMGIWKFPYNKVLTNLPRIPYDFDYEQKHTISTKYSYPGPGKTILIKRKKSVLVVPTIRFTVILVPDWEGKYLGHFLYGGQAYIMKTYWIENQDTIKSSV